MPESITAVGTGLGMLEVWGHCFRSPVAWGAIPATLCCLLPNELIFGMLREKKLTWLLVLSHLHPWGHRSVA